MIKLLMLDCSFAVQELAPLEHPTEGQVKQKLLQLADPLSRIFVDIPMPEGMYKEIGTKLLTDQRITIADSIPNLGDLKKGPG